MNSTSSINHTNEQKEMRFIE